MIEKDKPSIEKPKIDKIPATVDSDCDNTGKITEFNRLRSSVLEVIKICEVEAGKCDPYCCKEYLDSIAFVLRKGL